MRPSPMMPTRFSYSSTPVYFERFHSPAAREAWAAGMCRARRQDVADREFGGADDVGCRRVDDHHAGFGRGLDVDVVEPDAGAGDDLQGGSGGDRFRVDLRGRPHEHRVRVGERRQQGDPVGAVDVADVEVRAESLNRRGREFFGDEDDRLGHDVHFHFPAVLSTVRTPASLPKATRGFGTWCRRTTRAPLPSGWR